MYRAHVLVCGGTGCTSSGSQRILERLKRELDKQGLTKEVSVVQTGCHGLCALGPIMVVYPEAIFYSMVKEEDIPEIVEEHLLKGRVVKRLVYDETLTDEGVKSLAETDFYKKQHRIALRNCGVINPENIDEYIGFLYGMYSANHDVECIFIDGILKRDHIKSEDMPKFVERLEKISAQCDIDFYVSISAGKDDLTGINLSETCKVLN